MPLHRCLTSIDHDRVLVALAGHWRTKHLSAANGMFGDAVAVVRVAVIDWMVGGRGDGDVAAAAAAAAAAVATRSMMGHWYEHYVKRAYALT